MAYNALWFPHIATFLYVPLMLILLLMYVLWFMIIVAINFDSNSTKNFHILFRCICNISRWKNRPFTFFTAPVDLVICLHAMNRLHDSPLAIQRFCSIKNTLIRTFLRHINLKSRGKELKINEISTEERIHWYFQILPPQAPISLPNQNQTLNLVPLW